MKTELYKTINLSVNESATLLVVIDKQIEHEIESINFWFEKLNGAGTTQDVREWTASIKNAKDRLKALRSIQANIIDSEIITKHHLETA
tara:strand:+ start:14081 stop:14347 length:267 start_codon:yes stop_codon:yes gene_type:complete